MVPKVQRSKVLKKDPNPQCFTGAWLGVEAPNGTNAILLVLSQYLGYHILEPLKTRRLFDRKTGQHRETNLGAVHRIIAQSVGNKFAFSFRVHQKIKSLGESGTDRFLMEDGTMISKIEMQTKINQGEVVGVREHFFGKLTSDESERLRQSICTKGTKYIFVCKQDLPSIMSLGEGGPYNPNAQLMFDFDRKILINLLP